MKGGGGVRDKVTLQKGRQWEKKKLDSRNACSVQCKQKEGGHDWKRRARKSKSAGKTMGQQRAIHPQKAETTRAQLHTLQRPIWVHPKRLVEDPYAVEEDRTGGDGAEKQSCPSPPSGPPVRDTLVLSPGEGKQLE